MFAGIIEEIAEVIEVSQREHSLGIRITRPQSFDDIHLGDSIACNGICLTVEEFDKTTMQFTIGFETLQVTGWTAESLKNTKFHVERSLAMGQRIHGHLVSGHVDATCLVKNKKTVGDCLILDIALPKGHEKELWKKSSIAVNGVSLTVNDIEDGSFSLCLVPETLRKTNLGNLEVGSQVNVETDYYMKGLLAARGEVHA